MTKAPFVLLALLAASARTEDAPSTNDQVSGSCSFCPNNATVGVPDQLITGLGLTCGDYENIVASWTVDQCQDGAAVATPAVRLVQLYCECPGVATSTSDCVLCPSGQVLIDEEIVTATGLTCGQAESLVPQLQFNAATNQCGDDDLQSLAGTCCMLNSSDVGAGEGGSGGGAGEGGSGGGGGNGSPETDPPLGLPTTSCYLCDVATESLSQPDLIVDALNMTCGELREQVANYDDDNCTDVHDLYGEFCCDTVCFLCRQGALQNYDVVANPDTGATCADIALANVLVNSSDECDALEAQFSGVCCDNDDYCLVCGNHSYYAQPDRVVDPSTDTTCADVALLTLYLRPADCTDATRLYANRCCTPLSDDNDDGGDIVNTTCLVCADGSVSEYGNASKALTLFGGLTCEQAEQNCATLSAPGVDFASLCDCQGATAPNLCLLCDADQTLVDNADQVSVGPANDDATATCAFLYANAPFIIDSDVCESITRSRDICCVDPMPTDVDNSTSVGPTPVNNDTPSDVPSDVPSRVPSLSTDSTTEGPTATGMPTLFMVYRPTAPPYEGLGEGPTAGAAEGRTNVRGLMGGTLWITMLIALIA